MFKVAVEDESSQSVLIYFNDTGKLRLRKNHIFLCQRQ